MNNITALLLLFFIYFLSFLPVQNNRNKAQEKFPERKQYILSYLKKVIADSMVIVGQHCGNGNATGQGYRDFQPVYKGIDERPMDYYPG